MQQPYPTNQAPMMSQADHFKAIDAVMNSNADDQSKQRMIADIQEKYRAAEAGRANGNKPKNQKQYTKEDIDGQS